MVFTGGTNPRDALGFDEMLNKFVEEKSFLVSLEKVLQYLATEPPAYMANFSALLH